MAYQDDSLFTLKTGEIAAVLSVSLCLAVLVFYLALKLMARRHWGVRVSIACLAFVLFVWLSPQVYYTLYVFMLDGLSWQFVVDGPPSVLSLLKILAFSERSNLSFHGQGLLGWGLIAMAVFKPNVDQFLSLRRSA